MSNQEILEDGSVEDVAEVLEEADNADQSVSRRAFLRNSIIGGSALAAFSALPTDASAGSKGKLDEVFLSIWKHENEHVAFLVSALGAAARPKPTFVDLNPQKYKDFVALAKVFENTGVGAYLGAAPAIDNPAYLAAAASIATVEARHAGVLNVFEKDFITPGDSSFDSPLTADEVGQGIAPFVSSLNGGPPLGYSITPSPENDIAILNFALALEYLEAEFYNINVPRFFKKYRPDNGKKNKKDKKNGKKNN